MALTSRKFENTDRLNAFYAGRITGGISLLAAGGVAPASLYLHGLTLIFTTPAKTITFAASPANAQVPLTVQQVLTQVQAGGTLTAALFKGRLVIWVTTPGPIVLAHTGTANPLLGFDDTVDTSAKIISAPGGSTPVFVALTPDTGSNQLILTTDE